jgi:hypothetical protein
LLFKFSKSLAAPPERRRIAFTRLQFPESVSPTAVPESPHPAPGGAGIHAWNWPTKTPYAGGVEQAFMPAVSQQNLPGFSH